LDNQRAMYKELLNQTVKVFAEMGFAACNPGAFAMEIVHDDGTNPPIPESPPTACNGFQYMTGVGRVKADGVPLGELVRVEKEADL